MRIRGHNGSSYPRTVLDGPKLQRIQAEQRYGVPSLFERDASQSGELAVERGLGGLEPGPEPELTLVVVGLT